MIENWWFLRSLVFWKGFSKSEMKDFWRKPMPTFCRKPQFASFAEEGHTDEIIYVRFCRYVCISFANFLLCENYIAQINYSRQIFLAYQEYIFFYIFQENIFFIFIPSRPNDSMSCQSNAGLSDVFPWGSGNYFARVVSQISMN